MRASWMILASTFLFGCSPPPAEAPSAPEAPAPADGSPSTHTPAETSEAPSEEPSEEPAAAKTDPTQTKPAVEPTTTGPPPPLPKDTVVLHIGDSMADALGGAFNAELAKHGVKGYLEAKEATYIPQWAGSRCNCRVTSRDASRIWWS